MYSRLIHWPTLSGAITIFANNPRRRPLRVYECKNTRAPSSTGCQFAAAIEGGVAHNPHSARTCQSMVAQAMPCILLRRHSPRALGAAASLAALSAPAFSKSLVINRKSSPCSAAGRHIVNQPESDPCCAFPRTKVSPKKNPFFFQQVATSSRSPSPTPAAFDRGLPPQAPPFKRRRNDCIHRASVPQTTTIAQILSSSRLAASVSPQTPPPLLHVILTLAPGMLGLSGPLPFRPALLLSIESGFDGRQAIGDPSEPAVEFQH